VPWLKINGNTPPFCHMPSWYEQGQVYFYFTQLYFHKKNVNYNWPAEPKSIYYHNYGRVLPHRM
jgi:hypothetical protein